MCLGKRRDRNHQNCYRLVSLTRSSVNATVSVMLMADGGLFLASLVDRGGCQVRGATGVFSG